MTDEKTPTLKFQLVDPETKHEWTSGKSWQQLNEEIERLRADQNNMFDRIIRLETKVYALELPVRLKSIIELLKTQDKPRSLRFIQYRVSIGYWDFKKHLVDTGKVVVSESGTHKMYSVVPENNAEVKE